MAISDRTRKMLWASSGNRCAMCRKELIIAATSTDDASISGEECHIVSESKKGPRYDPLFPKDKIDSYENLILLCRVHHKLVDDQHQTHTVGKLRQIKTDHEKWVADKLSAESSQRTRIRIKRKKGNAPRLLPRITSGKQLVALAMGACQFFWDYSEPTNNEEAALISTFMDVVSNLDVYSDEASAQVQLALDLTEQIRQLDNAGFWVFADRENQVIEGGILPPASWPELFVAVIRKADDRILHLEGAEDGERAKWGDQCEWRPTSNRLSSVGWGGTGGHC